MKVLLYSCVFWPSLGGIETVTDVLAQNLTELGHECTVVTETPLADRAELSRPYRIVRRPRWRERLALAKQCDIVHANGATVSMYPYARIAGVPFVWTHNGYQVSCVDGLGWAYGEPAPMTPIASLAFHRRRRGWWYAAREALKLGVRRHVAHRVDLNMAGSVWVAHRQPLPNQVVTYNPYPLDRFKAVGTETAFEYDFGFVGRLVGEKGVRTLIHAFRLLVNHPPFKDCRLGVVGDGQLRTELQRLTEELSLTRNVAFLGALQGTDLVEFMGRARVGVVPSAWEEPYGGVTLEWLSAGRSVIVSRDGGHAECAGPAGLTFKNGSASALHECLVTALSDTNCVADQRAAARTHIQAFTETKLSANFMAMYELVVRKRAGA
jgi:glycosyltransferase involved in cell wall biosynthesis